MLDNLPDEIMNIILLNNNLISMPDIFLSINKRINSSVRRCLEYVRTINPEVTINVTYLTYYSGLKDVGIRTKANINLSLIPQGVQKLRLSISKSNINLSHLSALTNLRMKNDFQMKDVDLPESIQILDISQTHYNLEFQLSRLTNLQNISVYHTEIPNVNKCSAERYSSGFRKYCLDSSNSSRTKNIQPSEQIKLCNTQVNLINTEEYSSKIRNSHLSRKSLSTNNIMKNVRGKQSNNSPEQSNNSSEQSNNSPDKLSMLTRSHSIVIPEILINSSRIRILKIVYPYSEDLDSSTDSDNCSDNVTVSSDDNSDNVTGSPNYNLNHFDEDHKKLAKKNNLISYRILSGLDILELDGRIQDNIAMIRCLTLNNIAGYIPSSDVLEILTLKNCEILGPIHLPALQTLRIYNALSELDIPESVKNLEIHGSDSGITWDISSLSLRNLKLNNVRSTFSDELCITELSVSNMNIRNLPYYPSVKILRIYSCSNSNIDEYWRSSEIHEHPDSFPEDQDEYNTEQCLLLNQGLNQYCSDSAYLLTDGYQFEDQYQHENQCLSYFPDKFLDGYKMGNISSTSSDDISVSYTSGSENSWESI